MNEIHDIRTLGVIGTGVIGAGWAARALAHGLDVVAWDPGDGAEARLRGAVDNAWPAVSKLGLFEGASLDRLRFVSTAAAVCESADFIQENAPERLAMKTALHAEISASAAPHIVVASSTSGLLPSDFQAAAEHPQRHLVGHPFNPVYLLPLVEVLGGQQTEDWAVQRALAFYKALGMYPLQVRKEIPGFLSDRLQEALWREALHLVNEGVATTEELDAAISYGPGLRNAIWGTCLTFHLAGGPGGMRHTLHHFDPSQFPWTKLDPPPITEELVERMAVGCEQQAAGRDLAELERLRDQCLIGIMQSLRAFDVGAGKVLHEDEARRLSAQSSGAWRPGESIPAPLDRYRCRVLAEWVDYNGHMTEAAYLTAFGWATDELFRFIGDDESYRAGGHSYYTVETHINYYQECSVGDPLRVTTQVLGADEKRLHFFHQMYHDDSGELLATTEQMLLHVNTDTTKTCPTREPVSGAVAALSKAHADIPVPPQVGRRMSIAG